MERDTGIEPVLQPWEGRVVPLNQSRDQKNYTILSWKKEVEGDKKTASIEKIEALGF